MAPIDQDTRETLFAELDFHKAEFDNLREEILQWLETERQYINLCLVAIGAEVALVTIVLENRAFVVLLLFPFAFQVLLWEMLNAVQAIYALSTYLTDKLIPRINTIFGLLGNEREDPILGWEVHAAIRSETGVTAGSGTMLFMESLMPSRFWVPILAIASSLIAYIFLAGGYNHPISLWELVLVLVNLAFLIVSTIRSVMMSRTAVKRARRLRREYLGDSGKPKRLERHDKTRQPSAKSEKKDKGNRA